jgi:hypothetical protein
MRICGSSGRQELIGCGGGSCVRGILGESAGVLCGTTEGVECASKFTELCGIVSTEAAGLR